MLWFARDRAITEDDRIRGLSLFEQNVIKNDLTSPPLSSVGDPRYRVQLRLLQHTLAESQLLRQLMKQMFDI